MLLMHSRMFYHSEGCYQGLKYINALRGESRLTEHQLSRSCFRAEKATPGYRRGLTKSPAAGGRGRAKGEPACHVHRPPLLSALHSPWRFKTLKFGTHRKVNSEKQEPEEQINIRASSLIAYSRRQIVFSYSDLNLEMCPSSGHSLSDASSGMGTNVQFDC